MCTKNAHLGRLRAPSQWQPAGRNRWHPTGTALHRWINMRWLVQSFTPGMGGCTGLHSLQQVEQVSPLLAGVQVFTHTHTHAPAQSRHARTGLQANAPSWVHSTSHLSHCAAARWPPPGSHHMCGSACRLRSGTRAPCCRVGRQWQPNEHAQLESEAARDAGEQPRESTASLTHLPRRSQTWSRPG